MKAKEEDEKMDKAELMMEGFTRGCVRLCSHILKDKNTHADLNSAFSSGGELFRDPLFFFF